MKKWITGAFAIFIIWACSDAGSTGATAMTDVNSPPDGKNIFKIYCVNCHGLYGNMGANGAHDLTKSELSVEERIRVITNGRNTMTPFKKLLSEEKIKAVAAYTLQLKAQ